MVKIKKLKIRKKLKKDLKREFLKKVIESVVIGVVAGLTIRSLFPIVITTVGARLATTLISAMFIER